MSRLILRMVVILVGSACNFSTAQSQPAEPASLEKAFVSAPPDSFKTIRESTELPDELRELINRTGGSLDTAEWGEPFATGNVGTRDPSVRHVVSWLSADFFATLYQQRSTTLVLLVSDRETRACRYYLPPEIPLLLTVSYVQELVDGRLPPDFTKPRCVQTPFAASPE